MSGFVLDNSVTMRWLLQTHNSRDQKYTESVLKSMLEHPAWVPDLWHLEVVNVLLNAERNNHITSQQREAFIAQLENLPIEVDTGTAFQAFSRTLNTALIYKLSSYDAAYLELTIRKGLPLATLDKALRKAAKHAKVEIYCPS